MTAWAFLDDQGRFAGGQEFPDDRKPPKGAIEITDGTPIARLVGMAWDGDAWIPSPRDDLAPEPPQVAKRAEQEVAAKEAALAYLQGTDWYAARQIETGKPIPDDVQRKRAKARDLLSTDEP